MTRIPSRVGSVTSRTLVTWSCEGSLAIKTQGYQVDELTWRACNAQSAGYLLLSGALCFYVTVDRGQMLDMNPTYHSKKIQEKSFSFWHCIPLEIGSIPSHVLLVPRYIYHLPITHTHYQPSIMNLPITIHNKNKSRRPHGQSWGLLYYNINQMLAVACIILSIV